MAADASAYAAYAALGLEPGADAAAVDRAYKSMIKQFHPDRAGGDGRKAAEINRAYRELRDARTPRHALLFHYNPFEESANRWRRAFFTLAIVAVLLLGGSYARFFTSGPSAAQPAAALQAAAETDEQVWTMDDPLADAAIDDAIREAVRVRGSGDEMSLARVSRDCHQSMRNNPTLAQLDRCAAFDNAVAMLQDRDPMRDRGPFSELAVTGRLMSGATLISNDYMAIDSRLDRIRLKVELTLAPRPQSPPLGPEQI